MKKEIGSQPGSPEKMKRPLYRGRRAVPESLVGYFDPKLLRPHEKNDRKMERLLSQWGDGTNPEFAEIARNAMERIALKNAMRKKSD